MIRPTLLDNVRDSLVQKYFKDGVERPHKDGVVMLEEAGRRVKYWEYAIEHTFYIKIRIIHSSTGCTLFEELAEKKPCLKHIEVLGCAAFTFTENVKSKFHSRGQPAISFGCNDY